MTFIYYFFVLLIIFVISSQDVTVGVVSVSICEFGRRFLVGFGELIFEV